MNRALKWILGTVLALAALIAITLPMYSDGAAQTRMAAAVAHVLSAREGLQEMCNEGKFDKVKSVTEFGVRDHAPPSRVDKLEIVRVSPGVVRLKATLQDMHARPFYGLLAVVVVPQGSLLEFEFTCGIDKAVSMRYVGSTADPKYLPSHLRPKQS